MGGLLATGSSAPPPPDPNPSVDIKKKKKKKKKKTKKPRERLLTEIGSSHDQDQNLSQGEIANQDDSGPKETGDEGGEAGSSLGQDQHLSQAKNGKRHESGAGKDGDENQEVEKGEFANVVTPEASSSAPTEKTNPEPRPSSPLPICPICFEDMDAMDVSFHPCKCGFGLCLFCYNHIVEQSEGRCPGCRMPYDMSKR